MPPTKDKRAIKFVITETDRHTKGFTIYKITSMICSKSTPDVISKVSIWKRYSDLKKLHTSMKTLYSSLKIKEPYPSLAKPKLFGRFEAEVIEERRLCVLNFLEFVGRHRSLFTSEIFVKFFETSELSSKKPDYVASHSEDQRDLVEEEETASRDRWEQRSTSVTLHDGSDLPNSKDNSSQYILIAAAHMSAAFRHEAIAEYEEAFTQYKLGISHLLNGVQEDPDLQRKILIQQKISKYLQRAEKLYNRHLNCNVSVLNKPVSELKNYKVVQVMGPMMLVKDVLRGFTRIIKTVEKVVGGQEEANHYILRGKVPYMVQLYGCVQTDTTVFLILQYISGGKLYDFVEEHYKTTDKSANKKGHFRSSSCGAVMQIIPRLDEYSNPSNPTDQPLQERSISCSESLATNQLLENAKQLLQSVNATLKKSNSIASRLDESGSLTEEKRHLKRVQQIPTIKIDDESLPEEPENLVEEEKDLSELSLSDSFTDLSSIKDNDNSLMCDSITSDTRVTFGQEIMNEFCDWENSVVIEEPPSWNIPETVVQRWAAQIICALEALHQQDVIVADLRPDNLLITQEGQIAMTYVVNSRQRSELSVNAYLAPELRLFIHPVAITAAADVWSFGVLIYELLTGLQFQQKHLGEFQSTSILNIPDCLSENAKSLLHSILKYSPNERLTIPEVKRHSFFESIDWLSLLNY